jgi:hypothetical protein
MILYLIKNIYTDECNLEISSNKKRLLISASSIKLSAKSKETQLILMPQAPSLGTSGGSSRDETVADRLTTYG